MNAMTWLGNGLSDANHDEDALSVREATLSTLRRFDYPESDILVVQGNLATTYRSLGREEESLQMRRDGYYGSVKIYGEERESTLIAATNYAVCLVSLRRFEEAKVLLRKIMPVAQRVLGESNVLTLKMRTIYAAALFDDTGATLDDLREAVTTLEDAERIARRVLGGAHPATTAIEQSLRNARAALRARETPPQNAVDASS